ncbi:MAG TPA: DUF998 domain-containing protein [Candidatus Limnocylindria bacterium]|nr:DUF998 domain-containing protein [Candidatus Limnocylindria bacterium]
MMRRVGARSPAGLLLLVLGAAFLTVTMLAASIAPAYDFHAGAISDLGVIDQTAPLFNALLIVVGALNVAAGYMLYRWHRRAWLLLLYLLAGIGAAGAGVLPLDTGNAHSLFALAGFLFFNLEALGTATVLRGPMRMLSIAAGLIGLVYVVVMVIGDSGNPAIFGVIGHGGSERMIVYPAMLWTLVVGGYLLAAREP